LTVCASTCASIDPERHRLGETDISGAAETKARLGAGLRVAGGRRGVPESWRG